LSGVVLVDQIRVVDPAARPVGLAGRVSDDVLGQIKAKLAALLGLNAM
jgi:mRNA-degrading endonuclease toxin of MazEF toxin-antitoxin module